MALLLLKDNNCQIILKSMHTCRSYGPDQSGHTHMNIHLTKIGTAMSPFTECRLEKRKMIETAKNRLTRIQLEAQKNLKVAEI